MRFCRVTPYTTVLDYKFDLALDNQDYEKAQVLLENLEKCLQESAELIQYRIAWHYAKNEPEKVIALTKEATEKYPDNWGFAQANAYLSIHVTKSPDEAIKSLKKYLKNHTLDNVFSTLMEFYLKAGNFKKWEEIGKKTIKVFEKMVG